MAAHHFACCWSCENPLPVCEQSCDCATSYLVTGIAFSFSFTKDNRDIDCDPCPYPAGFQSQSSYNITVVGQQYANIAITRYGSGSTCYYQGTGAIEITYTVESETRLVCCKTPDGGIPTVLDDTLSQSWTGTLTVPVCITVRCVEADTANPEPSTACNGVGFPGAEWVHTLAICGFPISPNWSRLEFDYGGVAPGLPAQCQSAGAVISPVEMPTSLWMNRAVISWRSKLKCLDDLVTGDATLVLGACGSNPDGDPEVALCENYFHVADCGPFSVGTIAAYDEQEPPEPCEINLAPENPPTGSLFPTAPACVSCPSITFYGLAPTSNGCTPCNGWSGECGPCIRYDSGFIMDFWTYV